MRWIPTAADVKKKNNHSTRQRNPCVLVIFQVLCEAGALDKLSPLILIITLEVTSNFILSITIFQVTAYVEEVSTIFNSLLQMRKKRLEKIK